MTVIQELVEVLEERYTLSEIVEMLCDIDKQDIEDYAIGHNVCPRCYSQLELHTWKEARGDYFGSPAFEEMGEIYCLCCGASF
jgi:hypothetical protein